MYYMYIILYPIYMYKICLIWFGFMVFNTTFNNISAI